MALLSLQGLAYSVSGGWDTPLDHPGLFAAGGNTAAPAQFLQQLQRVLQVRIPLCWMPTWQSFQPQKMAAA